MASYVESSLINDEKILYTGKVSLWSLSQLFLGGLLLLILGFKLNSTFAEIGLLLFVYAYIRYKTTELAFTNKRVIAKSGFISRSSIEMKIDKVESVQVQQSILGRILNYGTLIISGAGNPQTPIEGISDPMAFRRAFLEYQEKN